MASAVGTEAGRPSYQLSLQKRLRRLDGRGSRAARKDWASAVRREPEGPGPEGYAPCVGDVGQRSHVVAHDTLQVGGTARRVVLAYECTLALKHSLREPVLRPPRSQAHDLRGHEPRP